MSAIDWRGMDAAAVFAALSEAPKVAGPWQYSMAGGDWDRAVPAFPNCCSPSSTVGCAAHVRSRNRKGAPIFGWQVAIPGKTAWRFAETRPDWDPYPLVGDEPTLREAMMRADLELASNGWLLVGDVPSDETIREESR